MENKTEKIRDRICCTSGECYRNDVMYAFEQETGLIVYPTIFWGPKQLYFEQDGYMYCFKPQIQKLIEDDWQTFNEDKNNNIQQINREIVMSFAGNEKGNPYTPHTFDYVEYMIKSNPVGMPKYIGETERFWILQAVGSNRITIDNITKSMLEQIEHTFTDSINPLFANIEEGLFEKEGTIYFTQFLDYANNPTGKLGVYVDPMESEKYPDCELNSYFFPFRPLTDEQLKYVRAATNMQNDYINETIIVEL